MSKLGLKYQIVFTNCELDSSNNYQPIPQTVTIDIYDRTSIIDDAAEVTVIPLTAAGDPLHIVSIDNSEDKFTPIRAQQAIIKFESDENFDLSIFTDTIYFTTPVGDPRYYVEIYIRSLFIFKGFLTFEDCSEAFMPTPNIVTLTATDGLGWLKDTPLTLQVTNPSGFYRIADYLAGALALTGLSLPLNAIFNIRELNNPADHLFDKVWLWDKTFEKDIGLKEDCYTVISKILGEESYLFQWNGEWWIVRPDEFDNTLTYRSIFNSDGSFNSAKAGTSLFQQFINKDTGTIFFSQESTEVIPSNEYKSAKETYNFDTPKETPCNINFERGAFIADLPNENDENGNVCSVKSYALDCWTLERFFPDHSPIANDSTVFIKRLFNANFYEAQRYIVMTFPSTQNVVQPHIKSEFIPAQVKDKFEISVDFKFGNEITSGGGYYNIMNIVLHGDDGSWWLHGRDEPGNTAELKWYNTSDFTVNTDKGQQNFNFATSTDDTQWQTQTFSVKPLPVSGNVYIWLHAFNVSSQAYDNVDVHYTNLSVTYIPFINGTYKKYTAISDKAYQPIDYRAIREKQVYMSDGIKKLFKGAMFRYNGTAYVLVADTFFDWHSVQSTTPAFQFIHSYLHIQTYDVWNQYRNVMRIFHCTAQGLQSNLTTSLDKNFIPYPSPVFHMILQDSSRHTNNKIFGMLTWDLDFYTCEWKGTIVELFNGDRGKRYDDPELIKYEQ